MGIDSKMTRRKKLKNSKTRKRINKGGALYCNYYQIYGDRTIYLGVNISSTGDGQFSYRIENLIIPRYQGGETTRFDNDLYDGFDINDAMAYVEKMSNNSYNNYDEMIMMMIIHSQLKKFYKKIQEKVQNKITDYNDQVEQRQDPNIKPMNNDKQWNIQGKIYFGIKIQCSKKGYNQFKLNEFILPRIFDMDLDPTDKLIQMQLQDIDAMLLFGTRGENRYGKHIVPINMNELNDNLTFQSKFFDILRKKKDKKFHQENTF